MKNKTQRTAAPAFQVNENVSLEEQIAQRGHEIWWQRGGTPGSELRDWFQAEDEITERHHQRRRNSA